MQEKYTKENPSFDWTDKGFTEGFFVILLWSKSRAPNAAFTVTSNARTGFSQQALQNWLYYFVSTKTDNISELARFTGILRGQESFAQAVSFGLNTRDWTGGRVPLAVNTVLLGEHLMYLKDPYHSAKPSWLTIFIGLAVVPTCIAVREHTPVEADKEYGLEGPSDEGLSQPELILEDKSKSSVVRSNLLVGGPLAKAV